ncbi:MAG: hypothetical protein MJ246_03610 [Clostridia bacterium]|nr:hypothetical protein [Clostridia bacterium]
MLLGFIIWSLITPLFIYIGISSRRSDKPAGFWANAEAPKESEITDVKKYNKAVSNILFTFAAIYELIGVTLLFLGQNDALLIIPLLGTFFLVIGIMVAYVFVEKKYKKK